MPQNEERGGIPEDVTELDASELTVESVPPPRVAPATSVAPVPPRARAAPVAPPRVPIPAKKRPSAPPKPGVSKTPSAGDAVAFSQPPVKPPPVISAVPPPPPVISASPPPPVVSTPPSPPAPTTSAAPIGPPPPSAVPPLPSPAPPKVIIEDPVLTPSRAWKEETSRLEREVAARAALEPSRAALLLVAHARLARALDEAGEDREAAKRSLDRAHELAPEGRVVANGRRWLAEQDEAPAAVLRAARAELEATADLPERVALLWQIAAIETFALNDRESAKKTLGELLALDPTNIAAWDALATLHLAKKQRASDDGFAVVVEALGAIAQATDDALVRGALHGAIGALRDRHLGDDEGALAALRRSLEADPTNVAAEATLERILLRRRAWDEYAGAVAGEGDRAADPLEARECYERAGDIYAECLSDATRAAAAYERAAEVADGDPSPLEKLARVFELAGDHEAAAQAWERLVPRLRDPAKRAWTLVRRGRLLETRLDRPDDALAAYQAAVDAAPTYGPAVHALLRVAHARGMTRLVVELERLEADRIADTKVRAGRYAALAELVEAHDLAGDDVTAVFERALALDPTNAAAFDALDRIHRANADWERLIALYEGALAGPLDPRRASALKLELAELLHARAGQPDRAATLLREVLQQPEERFRTLMALARACATTGRWPEYVEALEAQASMLGGADEVAAVYRIGTTLETRVKDTKRALAAYEIVLDRAPRHEAAARAVIRIHEQEGRWEKVIDAERRLLELLTRPEDSVESLMRIARIYEENLGRVGDAIIAYTDALKHTPGHAPALAAVERLLRGVGEHARLAQILQKFAAATTDATERARAMLRAAAILELHVKDLDGAAAAYGRVLAESKPDAADPRPRFAALSGQLRLQGARGDWEGIDRSLNALLAMATKPRARVRLLVALARNAEVNLGDITRAARLLEDALALGGEQASIAVDALRIARQEGNREAIAHAITVLASATSDTALDASLQHGLATMREYGGQPEQAIAIYDGLAARDPSDLRAVDGLLRCTRSSAARARALLGRARATGDGALRSVLAFTSGVLHDLAERASEAAEAFTFALEAEPELLPALDGARRIRTVAEDWPAVAELAERAARASLDRENAAQSWLEAASVHEDRLSAPRSALACVDALLGAQPGHGEALDRALFLLEGEGGEAGARRAVELLRAHADAVTDDEVRVRSLTRRATLLASRLGDTAGAIADLRRVLDLSKTGSDMIGTMQSLAQLEERAKNWQEALALHERVAKEPVADSTTRRRARLAQARIHGEELQDNPRAETILAELAREHEDDREIAVRLAHVSAKNGKEQQALEIWERLANVGTTTERIDAIASLAQLIEKSTSERWTQAEADAALANAFDVAMQEPDALPYLEERIERDRDITTFVTMGEAAVARVPPSTAGALPFRTALARVLRDRLGKPDAADRHLAVAVQAFPESMPTRLALAQALIGRNDDAALGELRRAIERDPSAPGPYDLLAKAARSVKRPNTGAMLATAAAILGGPKPTAETETSLAQLRPVPESLLPQEAMTRLGGPSRTWFLRNVLAILDPWMHKIFPGGEAMVESRGRLPDSYPIVSDVRAIAAALGVPTPIVCRGAGRTVEVLLTEPRAIVLGSDLLTDAGRPLALFHSAYACARIAAFGSVYAAPRDQVMTLLEAAIHPDAEGPQIKDFRKRISSALPRKNKKDLERIVGEGGGGDLAKDLPVWAAEEGRRALYAATLFCRDLRAVAHVIAESALLAPTVEDRRKQLLANASMRELLEYIASPACWDTFQRIYGRP